jgi:hypothetical protein
MRADSTKISDSKRGLVYTTDVLRSAPIDLTRFIPLQQAKIGSTGHELGKLGWGKSVDGGCRSDAAAEVVQ